MKIVITGSNSQLAHSLITNLKNININYKAFNKTELDITNSHKSEFILKKISPNFIINCAAYTQVDKAELEKKNANDINNIGLKNLSLISNKLNCTLIHFSTDYVFNGQKNNKYTEEDTTDPISYYGKTKLDGEHQIFNLCNNFLILRISWLFSLRKNNFVTFVLDKLSKNEDIFCVNDQIGIPTCTEDVSKFLLFYFNINNKKINREIYHFVNNGHEVSWYEFANKILIHYNKYASTSSKIIPIESKNLFKNNIRPRYSALNNKKIQYNFDFKIDNWENSLNEIVNKYFNI